MAMTESEVTEVIEVTRIYYNKSSSAVSQLDSLSGT